MLVLVAVGVLALAFVLATVFTTLTEQTTELSSTVPLPVGSEEFAVAMEAVALAPRQPIGPPIRVFDDGQAFLGDLLAEIARAQASVTVTNYIFREGRMANALFDALAESARRGVEVRVLLDWNGARHAPEERIEALRRAGGRVAEFRPLDLRHLTRFLRRTHARALVVDGEVGYTGGLAFDDGWLGQGVGPEQWRDLTFKLGGPVARATQDHFNALWRQTTGEVLSGADFYPADGAADADTTTAAPRSWFVSLFHDPQPDLSTDLQDLIWLSIVGARRHVYIATPYMTPDEDVRDALMAAARRGVRVEVVMPGPYTDAKLIQAATRAYYDELLGAGVRIFEYQPGRFHEKTLTVDGRWSIIGSANMDNRSATLNVENVFAVEDPALAAALEGELALVKGRAIEVTLRSWDPNPLEELYHNAARVFAKQY